MRSRTTLIPPEIRGVPTHAANGGVPASAVQNGDRWLKVPPRAMDAEASPSHPTEAAARRFAGWSTL